MKEDKDYQNYGEPAAQVVVWHKGTSAEYSEIEFLRNDLDDGTKLYTHAEVVRDYQALSASTEPSAPVEIDERAKFTEQEVLFFRAVMLSPDCKLSDCCFDREGNALWKKLESAGLIECTGSYKWKPTIDVIGIGIRAVLDHKP